MPDLERCSYIDLIELEVDLRARDPQDIRVLTHVENYQKRLYRKILSILNPKGPDLSNFGRFYLLLGTYFLKLVHSKFKEVRPSHQYSVFSDMMIKKSCLKFCESNLPSGHSFFLSTWKESFLQFISWVGNPDAGDKIRNKALKLIDSYESYTKSIDYEKLQEILGIGLNSIDFVPQFDKNLTAFKEVEFSTIRKFYEETGSRIILYNTLHPDYSADVFDFIDSPIDCSDPSAVSRLFSLFRDKELIEIQNDQIPNLVRALFNIESKYHSRYQLKIPEFKITSEDFSVDLKASLRKLRESQVIRGKVKSLSALINHVFPMEGLSPRSIENAFKPSTKMNFKCITENEFMGVCGFTPAEINGRYN